MGEEDGSIIVQDTHTKADFIREVEEEAWSDFVAGRNNNITEAVCDKFMELEQEGMLEYETCEAACSPYSSKKVGIRDQLPKR